ncbi:hypothetical protein [Lactiplantibacillus pentosus]
MSFRVNEPTTIHYSADCFSWLGPNASTDGGLPRKRQLGVLIAVGFDAA